MEYVWFVLKIEHPQPQNVQIKCVWLKEWRRYLYIDVFVGERTSLETGTVRYTFRLSQYKLRSVWILTSCRSDPREAVSCCAANSNEQCYRALRFTVEIRLQKTPSNLIIIRKPLWQILINVFFFLRCRLLSWLQFCIHALSCFLLWWGSECN